MTDTIQANLSKIILIGQGSGFLYKSDVKHGFDIGHEVFFAHGIFDHSFALHRFGFR